MEEKAIFERKQEALGRQIRITFNGSQKLTNEKCVATSNIFKSTENILIAIKAVKIFFVYV